MSRFEKNTKKAFFTISNSGFGFFLQKFERAQIMFFLSFGFIGCSKQAMSSSNEFRFSNKSLSSDEFAAMFPKTQAAMFLTSGLVETKSLMITGKASIIVSIWQESDEAIFVQIQQVSYCNCGKSFRLSQIGIKLINGLSQISLMGLFSEHKIFRIAWATNSKVVLSFVGSNDNISDNWSIE